MLVDVTEADDVDQAEELDVEDSDAEEFMEGMDELLTNPSANSPPPFQLPPQIPLPGLRIAVNVPPLSSPI